MTRIGHNIFVVTPRDYALSENQAPWKDPKVLTTIFNDKTINLKRGSGRQGILTIYNTLESYSSIFQSGNT